MEYLLKANAVIAIFYICYKVFLERETFFEYNRWFLIIGLLAAFTIPFIVIPVYIEQSQTSLQEFIFIGTDTVTASTETSIDLNLIISNIYLIGITFFGCRLVLQFYSLFLLIRKGDQHKQGHYTFIKTNDVISPFSFFNWIVYNPEQFNENELTQILAHEKVHVRQHHSLDILISQISIIVFWFNPFIWLYKKDLQQNLEFIADNNAQNKLSCKKSYQYLLLKSSVPTHQLALTNNFYNSLIKKRIVMLHKSKSSKIKAWKSTLIIPVLVMFLMSFNTKEVYLEKPIEENGSHSLAYPLVEKSINTSLKPFKENNTKNIANTPNSNIKKEKSNSAISSTQNSKIFQDREMVIITKNLSGSDLDAIKSKLSNEGITVKFKGIKRNSDNEIRAIKIDVSSKQSNANYNISSDEPINPIKISFDREGGNISIGDTSIIHGDGFVFETKDGKHKIHEYDIDDDEIHFDKDHDGKIEVIIENIHDNSKNKKKTYHIKKNKKGKIHTIIDEDTVIDIDNETEIDSNVDVIVIKEDKNGNIVKEEIRVDKDKNVWIGKDKSFKVKTIEKSNGNKVFISTDEGKTPLYVVDGKEMPDYEIGDLDADQIETINVLKGESATEKYGDKAKDGVVEVVTKKKD
jgi:hypothetical protein